MKSLERSLKRLPGYATRVVEDATESAPFFQLFQDALADFNMKPRFSDQLNNLNAQEKIQVAHDLMLSLIQNNEVKNKVNSPAKRVILALNSLKVDKNKVATWVSTLNFIVNQFPDEPVRPQDLFENIEHLRKEKDLNRNTLFSSVDILKNAVQNLNLEASIT